MNDAYEVRPAWQQRVIDEKAQLDERTEKLTAFLGTRAYAELADIDRELLLCQRMHMRAYSSFLSQRIERFTA